MAGPLAPTLVALAASYRDEATRAEPYNAGAAYAWRRAADLLDGAVREAADELLSLADAARECGLSTETLRKRLAAGVVPNAGTKHRPRVRRANLPARQRGATTTAPAYDADADALSILRRQAS